MPEYRVVLHLTVISPEELSAEALAREAVLQLEDALSNEDPDEFLSRMESEEVAE
jgi:hypothetical protein